ncbi:MAG: TIGR02206 family membrane protein [Anaerolineae bacterium]|nr:TIGR02206 family membrane protein [Anaerolineae bacterium]
MGDFFTKDWTGAPFITFGPAHLIGLGIIALCIAAMIYFGRKASDTGRRNIRYGLAGLILFIELSWHIWNLATGQWNIQTMLPLHLCSVMIWLSIFMLLTKNYTVFEFGYLLGMAGALQALLTPDAGIYGFPHFRAFQVLISHGALVAAFIYMATVENFRPTPKSIVKVLLFSNLYGAVVFGINFLIGSNYLFIAHKPETTSIIDLMPPWPWYIAIIELLGIIFMLLFYLPYAIKDWSASRSTRRVGIRD